MPQSMRPPSWVHAVSRVPAEVLDRLDAAFAASARAIPHEARGEFRVDFAGLPAMPAALVRWLLLEALPGMEGGLSRLVICDASIAGWLNLCGARLSVTPCFAACRIGPALGEIDAGIDLTDAAICGLEVIGGEPGCIRADRLTATGTVLIRGGRPDPSFRHELPTHIGDSVAVPRGILLSGAKIRGNLDLRGARVGPLTDLADGAVVALLADGLALEGNALLGGGFASNGEVRLNGARIQRNLDCSGGHLSHPGGYSLSAAGAEINGSVYFGHDPEGRPAVSVGMVRFDGTRIKGDLDFSGANLTATAFHLDERITDHDTDPVIAFQGVALDVGATARFSDAFHVSGAINLISAKIGGDLVCSHGRFHFPGEEAFYADGATIAGGTYFDGARASGLVRFVQAQLKQGCFFQKFTVDLGFRRRGWSTSDLGPDVAGLYAAGTVVGGSFVWTGVNRFEQGADRTKADGPPRRVVWLAAPGASVTEISDDCRSWAAVDQIDVRDCVYQRIDRLTAEVDWRIARLDRQYAAWNTEHKWGRCRLAWEVWCRTRDGEQYRDEGLGIQVRRFTPGPYLQLARVLRESGYENAAQAVLLRLERNRARYGGLSKWALLWRWLLDATLLYGQEPFRPVLAVFIWICISGPLFKWVYDTQLTPGVRALRQIGNDHVTFNCLFYALDTLIPFVDFGQKKHFVIDPIFSWGGALLLLNTIIGYAAASFFAAGLSGLVRSGRG